MSVYQLHSDSSIAVKDTKQRAMPLALALGAGLTILNPMFVDGNGTGDNLSLGLAYSHPEILSSNVFTVPEYSTPKREQLLDVRTIGVHLENIRQVFDLPMSDLASVFGVSRQMVYKWIDGAQPEEKSATKIIALSQIADTLVKSEVQHIGNLIKMKLFDGYSLLDVVREGKSWKVPVEKLIVEAKAMEKSYAQSGVSTSKAKPTNDWMLDQSIPYLVSVTDD
jgi:DNA-binding transcriptional regulator YiaG